MHRPRSSRIFRGLQGGLVARRHRLLLRQRSIRLRQRTPRPSVSPRALPRRSLREETGFLESLDRWGLFRTSHPMPDPELARRRPHEGLATEDQQLLRQQRSTHLRRRGFHLSVSLQASLRRDLPEATGFPKRSPDPGGLLRIQHPIPDPERSRQRPHAGRVTTDRRSSTQHRSIHLRQRMLHLPVRLRALLHRSLRSETKFPKCPNRRSLHRM